MAAPLIGSRGRRVRIYVKKQIVVSHLNLSQRQMLAIGNVGLAARKEEIARGLNAKGAPAKPLSKGYAIRKSKLSKWFQGAGRNKRDLRLTGAMLREWTVRTVSTNEARAGWSTLRNRTKAAVNNAIEEFVAWSPENQKRVMSAANQVVNEVSKRIVLEKTLND
jgi:hypothetical protein